MFERRSFSEIEAKARAVLRERGLTDEQVEKELHKPQRYDEDIWFPPWWDGDSESDADA